LQNHLFVGEFGKARDDLVLFGFSEKEASVYITLLANGELRAGEIASHLSMHRLDVYHVLKNLQAKDMVQATISKPMKFSACSIRRLIEIIRNELRQDFKTKSEALGHFQKFGERMESYLEAKRARNQYGTSMSHDKIQIISGRKSIDEKWTQLLSEAQDEILVAAPDQGSARNLLLRAMDEITGKMKAGVKVRIFTPVSNLDAERFQDLTSEVRHLNSSNSAGFLLVDRKRAMIIPESGEGSNSAILTDSPSIVEMLNVLFFEGWNSSPLMGDSANVIGR
jgi:sugar-specific transcriptional regulator TrmB